MHRCIFLFSFFLRVSEVRLRISLATNEAKVSISSGTLSRAAADLLCGWSPCSSLCIQRLSSRWLFIQFSSTLMVSRTGLSSLLSSTFDVISLECCVTISKRQNHVTVHTTPPVMLYLAPVSRLGWMNFKSLKYGHLDT
jgi:hypothetical protein